MTPLIEVMTLVPEQATGGWIAHFRFLLGAAEYDAFVFCAAISEPIMAAQALIETGKPLEAARYRFLNDVHLTTKH